MLVGPSGCGKTTAMRMVNRMIDITDGDILVGGRSVRERDEAELRRDIGYVIQQIGLFPHRTIGENIATVPRLLGWDKRRTAARVDELLDLIGLPREMRGRYPAQLSGGQRQRVGVARALAADPPLMLMDEPFGAIDPINRERLQNEFLRLQAELRKTIVFVTHDIDEAIKMGDRIAVMQEGGILAQYGAAGRAADAPGERVRRGLRRRRPRAQAARAAARARRRPVARAARARRRAGRRGARAGRRRPRSPIPLLVDDDGRPLGWLSERALAGDVVPTDRAPARSRSSSSTTCCATRSATCSPHEVQYGPVVDAQGRVVGVLSIELLSHVIAERDVIELFAQLEIRDRERRATASPTTASARAGSPTTSTAT